eukprot:scaffold19441_cov31-Tisochrysis_lutea.AAC.1
MNEEAVDAGGEAVVAGAPWSAASSRAIVSVVFERQEAYKCGRHALNALLQGEHVFTDAELFDIPALLPLPIWVMASVSSSIVIFPSIASLSCLFIGRVSSVSSSSWSLVLRRSWYSHT